VLIKPDTTLPASLAVALLLALPAAAQIAPSGDKVTPNPAVSDDGTATPAATPVLESPALGPLSGRDTPLPVRPSESGILPGFSTTAPGLGVAGISTFDLGNRPYAIRPSLGVDILATDNLFQASYDRRGDIVTTIAPSIEAAVSTTRLSGSLRYTPALRIYAFNSSQNGLDQIGDGQLLAALVPGTFYLDMRGAASVLPATAGVIPGSGQVVAGSNTVQTYTTQVTPFLVHNFGSAASSQLGYSFQYSGQSGAVFNSSDFAGFNSAANFTAHRGFAVLRSGQDLGRLALQARVDGIWYVGSGIYDDAHSFIAGLGVRYAILRSVALTGDIGYENQRYAGTDPVNIDDAVWSVGLRLTPSPDSIVIVRYGHQNGFNSFYLNAGVALGVRTSLFATYSDTLGTSLTQGQNLLSTTTTDALGNTVDSQSGAPVVLINSFLGLTDTLYRTRLGTVSLNHRWPRDAFTLSGTWQSQDPVTSVNSAASVTSSNGIYATFSWVHEFSPNTTGVATAQYGQTNAGQIGFGSTNLGQTNWGDSDTYALAATLSHRLSEKLTASLQVSWSNSTSPVANQGYTQGVIRAGFRRTF
jgi:uncharacterized protein (PEP-CTERM system associated)